MAQQLGAMTKAVAVALDIAGRPDTDDAYALNSVRKAYRLLNGLTFQDLVETPRPDKAPDVGIDWAEVYQFEAQKTQKLADQVRQLEEEISKAKSQPSPAGQPSEAFSFTANETHLRMPRTERVREEILATLSEGDCTGQELSRITQVHLRTVQRRLRELISAGLVRQATDDISPIYALTKKTEH